MTTGPTVAQTAPQFAYSYCAFGQSNPLTARPQTIATYNNAVENEQIAANLSTPPDTTYYKRHVIVTLGAVFVRTISDTYTASESLLKKATKVRTDTLTASETRLIKAIKQRTDTLTASESITRIWIHVRTLSDTLSKSETLLKKAIKVRTDTGSLTESITKRVSHSIQDTLSKSETLTKILTHVRTLSDTLTKSETLLKTAIKARADTLGKSESITKVQTKVRTLSDTLSVSETLLKRARKVLSDTLSASESITKTRIRVRTLSDTLGKSESLVKKTTKLLADTRTASEQLLKTAKKILSDTLGKSETLTGQKVTGTITRTLSDTYGATETLTKNVIKAITDNLGSSELLLSTRQFFRFLVDSRTVSESINKRAQKAITETATATEATIKKTFKVITDTLNASESLDSTRIRENIVRTLTDTYTAAELIGKIVIYHITDVIGGGGGFKQFIHQIVDTYYSSEIIQSFVTKAVLPGTSMMQAKGLEIAKNVRIAWQRRQVKPTPPIPRLQLQRPKLVLKTLSDSYVTTESIQVKVIKFAPQTTTSTPKIQQLSSAQLVKETIIKTLGPEIANQYVQKVIAKEREDKRLMVQQAIVEKIKLIKAQGDPDARSLKLQKLLKLLKLNKLIQLALLHKTGLEVEES
ncbi:MAG TPA: hypothetical protein VEV83_15395 [Parafilimonas sp.]|nr:hypothetical protein [Parafilimonas sp.]